MWYLNRTATGEWLQNRSATTEQPRAMGCLAADGGRHNASRISGQGGVRQGCSTISAQMEFLQFNGDAWSDAALCLKFWQLPFDSSPLWWVYFLSGGAQDCQIPRQDNHCGTMRSIGKQYSVALQQSPSKMAPLPIYYLSNLHFRKIRISTSISNIN